LKNCEHTAFFNTFLKAAELILNSTGPKRDSDALSKKVQFKEIIDDCISKMNARNITVC
jgi:hypothetical protein